MKKPKKKSPTKRATGKRLRTYAFKDSDVERWQKAAEKQNRSLTNLIETVMNDYVK